MTRKRQLWALIFLSALTAAAQYVIQGVQSTGGDFSGFPPWFWAMDYGMWALRGLVESWVIIYLFTTAVDGLWRNAALTLLELALLALIVFTVGPALEAVGRGVPVYIVLQEQYGTWQRAIGAYTALMMAGAGFAYKFQPHDAPDLGERYRAAMAELDRMKAEMTELKRDDEALRLECQADAYRLEHIETTLRKEHDALPSLLAKAEWRGARPEVAEWLGL